MACGCVAWLLADVHLPAQELPRFRERVISKAVKFGYQLVAADLNGDGKKDLIAVDERATEVAWFENPTWERHVLATNVPRPLNAACCDIDGDGVPEVVLAYRFETSPEQSVGNVVLLTHGKDVRQPWSSSMANGPRPIFRREIPDLGPCAAAVKCAWAISVRSAFWSPSSLGTEIKWWSICRRAKSGSG